MLGIGEVVLLILAFLFAGGAVSRLAKWAFFRRASGAKQALWVLTDLIKSRSASDAPPTRSEVKEAEEPSPPEREV